jgi:preprotein translocase subunit YajC
MFNEAWAMAPGGGGSQQGGIVDVLIPFAIIFVIFYFVLIRPQQKKNKDHQKFLGELKKGDNVVTSGGIIGKVVGVADKVITIEIGDNVKIKVLRDFISGPKADESLEPKK